MEDITNTEEEPSDDQKEVLDYGHEGPDEEEGEDALNDLEHGYIIPEVRLEVKRFLEISTNQPKPLALRLWGCWHHAMR